jgi:hypothetical protein
LLLLALALAAAPGCGSNELESTTAKRLRGLARVYLDYAVPKNGKGPDSEAVLREHLRRLPDFVLQTNGVDPAGRESLFVSERDGAPFVVRYGASVGTISGNSTVVVAHEKAGKDGKRLVVFVSAKVELADEARFQQLLSANP